MGIFLIAAFHGAEKWGDVFRQMGRDGSSITIGGFPPIE